MGIILVLPETVASQVAAGEVVERPASVVKELVENSLDAQARHIEVRADRGGVALLRVSDDGTGMPREDALLALERHATSKLRDAAGLASLRTLGFRGEALPSIASVSRFTVQTREHGALVGTEIFMEGGRLGDVRDWGGAPGTVMEARQLFYNVPARRKFLRSEATELAHIEQVVRVQAVAHPEVGFTLLRDGRLLFQWPAGGSLRARLHDLLGPEQADRFLEQRPAERDGLRVHGYVAAPGCFRGDRSLTLTFINGRPVENPALTHALRAAYGDTLARGQHPLCCLFIDMPPEEVDVNVHPAKKEVRFRHALRVQQALASLLQETLREWTPGVTRVLPAAESPVAPREETVTPKPLPPVSTPPISTLSPRPQPQPTPVVGPAPVPARPAPVAWQRALPLPEAPPSPEVARSGENGAPPASAPPRRTFRVLGTLADRYAILESDEGLVLLHFRAAHERILYEEMRTQAAAGPVPSQPLLLPLLLKLAPRDFALALDHLTTLQRLGFGVEEFGGSTLKLEAVPAFLPMSNLEEFFQGLLAELARTGEIGARAKRDLDALAALISARATPTQQSREPAEIASLLDRLLRCELPYCDPAGRPTLIQFSLQELARKFGR